MDPKQSNLLKLEAMALFTCLKAQFNGDRWAFFPCARLSCYPINILQTISPYRASLHFSYVYQAHQQEPKTGQQGPLMAVTTEVYLEREATDDHWRLSFTGLEGKVEALMLTEALKPLAEQGYYIPNGNENLERQMNFSLGLYGDCLMHVDIHFPVGQPPLPAAMTVIDHLEQLNAHYPLDLTTLLARTAGDEEAHDDDGLVIMGDWQTWK